MSKLIYLKKLSFIRELFLISILIETVRSHGYMIEPPSRNSAWRVFGSNSDFSVDYDDNGLIFNHICGSPRHSIAGKIVRTYKSGQNIRIDSVLTANHLGTIQVGICPNSNPTQECFENNRLEVLQYVDSSKNYQARIPSRDRDFNYTVRIPSSLSCGKCVLQWRWYAMFTGEVYSNCADIAIIASNDEKPEQPNNNNNIPTIRPSRIIIKVNRTASTTTTTTTLMKVSTRLLTTTLTTTTKPKNRDPSQIRVICSKNSPPVKTFLSDLLKYRGSVVVCYWMDKKNPLDCDYCKDHCLTDLYYCPPEECECRWHP